MLSPSGLHIRDCPVPPDLFKPLYECVGSIVINWGVAGSVLEKCVAAIFQGGVGTGLQRKLPRTLSDKVGFVRRAVTEVEDLKPLASETEQILSEISSLATVRHALIHGALSAWDPAVEMFGFLKLDVEKGETIHTANIHWFTFADLLDADARASAVSHDALQITDRFFDVCVRQAR